MNSPDHRNIVAQLGLALFLVFTVVLEEVLLAELQTAVLWDPPSRMRVVKTETERPVQLLIRDFPQNGEDAKFGFFVYLIFAQQSRATYNKRLAAAEEFLCFKSTPSQALELGLPIKLR